MAKQKLIVVHGMGSHTKESVKKEVTEAFESSFGLYEKLKNESVDDKVDIVPYAYDHFFDDYRNKLKDGSQNVLDTLASISGDLPAIPKLTSAIAEVDSSVQEDKFFNTHWLDVILYTSSLLCEPVRLGLAEVLSTAIIEAGSANVHILGHSLGTAVVHDTLAKAYGVEPVVVSGKPIKLLNHRDRLAGVHQVANVSRLLQSFRKVGASEVRPGDGCCGVYAEYRHKLDPIPKVKPFDPTDNGEWIPHHVFRSSYKLVEPSAVKSANVHALGHYLQNPSVHQVLFQQLFGFRPNKTEREAANDTYLAGTVQGKAAALRDAADSLGQSPDSVGAMLVAAITLKNLVLGFAEEFK